MLAAEAGGLSLPEVALLSIDGLTCRIYGTEDSLSGSPSVEQQVAVLR